MARDEREVQKKPAQQSWDDQLSAALPQKAVYFDAIRTDAFINQNVVQDFVEFWVAMRVDEKQDKWRVMHYMILDLDKPDGIFQAERMSETDVSFPEAVYQVAQFEKSAIGLGTYKSAELTEKKFPASKFPELKVHYFDIEHYKLAANIEGIAFSNTGRPYRRVEGKIFSDAIFERSEIAKSILVVEQARENPKVAGKIEAGILSDIFASASSKEASLDNILKVAQTLACMDEFVAQVGAFYLGVQSYTGADTKGFDKLQDLTAEEKKELLNKATSLLPSAKSNVLETVLAQAHTQLDEADKLGIHTEPFRKFISECELYANLLRASQNLVKLKGSLDSVGGANMKLLASIKDSVEAAQQTFLQLGGSIEQVDRLKAWVATPQKETIPQWLPGFIDRYYDQRHKVMKKVQERQAGAREIKTMSVKVKPPVLE